MISKGSTWDDVKMPRYPKLDRDIESDVVVIGGGITGLMCAYLLTLAGIKVVLIEKGKLCYGATGVTTAFLTQVIDTDLRKLIKMYGRAQAEKIIKAHQYAIDRVEEIIRKNKIECEFIRCDDYSYAWDKNSAKTLMDEVKAAHSLGIKAKFENKDIGFNHYGYIKIQDQAKFHPLRFLSRIAKIITANGGKIFENTSAEKITGKGPYIVETKNGDIAAHYVVVATYAPFDKKLHFKKAFYDSYIIEASIPHGIIPEGIYEDTMDPYHYFRIDPKGRYDRMIIGGEDHRSDVKVQSSKNFRALKKYIDETFPGMKYNIVRRWKGPILETIDGLAYIGSINDDSIFYTTGFSGNGMTYGILAAYIISHEIVGDGDEIIEEYASIYDSKRKPTLKRLAHKGVDYSREFIHGAVKNTVKA